MTIEKDVQIVKNFLAALGRRDKRSLLALSAEDLDSAQQRRQSKIPPGATAGV